ncbi:MAG TPA: hypothetical protein VF009_06995 [Solirubrobacterales bacterium]
MEAAPPTQRQREAAESEHMRLHQALGFEVDRADLLDVVEQGHEEASRIAAEVIEHADQGTLDQMNLDDAAKAILRESIGGSEAAEALMDEIDMDAEDDLGIMVDTTLRPLTEGTGQRIAYALEVLASAARPDIFETQEAQQDDLQARLREFGVEAIWPEGKTFAEAAGAGEISFGGSAVARGSE